MSRQLSKKTLDQSFWNWFFWNGCSQQAESMLGMAFGQSMAPVVEELYDTKEEKAQALKRHVTPLTQRHRWDPSATALYAAWRKPMPMDSARRM